MKMRVDLIGFISVDELCIYLISYLDLRDVKVLESMCSHTIQSILSRDILWRYMYHIYFCAADRGAYLDERIRRKLQRPFKKDCVGWIVNILQDTIGPEVWKRGTIRNYRLNSITVREEYLIAYEGESESVWEEESRKRGPLHLAGLSRFDFLSPSESATQAKNISSESSVFNPYDAASIFENSNNDTTCWRDEVHKLLHYLPTKCAFTLRKHRDEVLDLEFSHNGRYLATCSRDGTICITEFSYSPATKSLDIVKAYDLRTWDSHHACKVLWSNDDKYVCVVMEALQTGAPDGLIQIFNVQTADFDIIDNALIYPYDFYAPWINDHDLIVTQYVSKDLASQRLFQEITIVDVEDFFERKSYFRILGSLTNYAHCAEILRLPPAFDTEDGSKYRNVLLFMSCENPFICHYIYMLDLTNRGVSHDFIDCYSLPRIDCKGAILSIHANRVADFNKYIVVNCRAFTSQDYYRSFEGCTMGQSLSKEAPDVLNEVECRVYSAETMELLHCLRGHHAFTLKSSIFFLYLDSLLCNPSTKGTVFYC